MGSRIFTCTKCYGLNCVTQHSHVDILIPNMTIFEIGLLGDKKVGNSRAALPCPSNAAAGGPQAGLSLFHSLGGTTRTSKCTVLTTPSSGLGSASDLGSPAGPAIISGETMNVSLILGVSFSLAVND